VSQRDVPFTLAGSERLVGTRLGISPWVFIDQTQVNVFAEVTRWRTPGHCDPEYASNTKYGGTLMHGFHVISLLSHFFKSAELWPEDGQDPLNYGVDKVRILKPIIIGDGVRLRSHISLIEVVPKKGNDMLVKTKHEIEVQNIEGFAIYAEYLTYWHAV
jgi:acyl dehydratase